MTAIQSGFGYTRSVIVVAVSRRVRSYVRKGTRLLRSTFSTTVFFRSTKGCLFLKTGDGNSTIFFHHCHSILTLFLY